MMRQRSYYPKGWRSDPAVPVHTAAGYGSVEGGPSPVADPVHRSSALQSGSPLPDYWFLLLACQRDSLPHKPVVVVTGAFSLTRRLKRSDPTGVDNFPPEFAVERIDIVD